MVVCYSHSLLPLCQLSLTSPLARGDILSCISTVCLCIKLSSASRADRRTTNGRPYGVAGSFRFVCRFR